jgi:hypothetical protein
MMKKLTALLMVALLALVAMPNVMANELPVDLEIVSLKIDGDEYDVNDRAALDDLALQVRRGEELPIRLKVKANSDVEDVQITAGIFGYDYSDYESDKVFETTDTFDLKANKIETVDLDLEIPVRMDVDEDQDTKLRIFVADRYNVAYTIEYNLFVQGIDEEEAIWIKDAYLSPSNTVQAGRALTAQVRVENIGDDDLDDITLKVRVPELNIQDTETLDELDEDESETFEKIVLRFPADTQAGEYTVEYIVTFDEFEEVRKTDIVRVIGNEVVQDEKESKTYINVLNSQSVNAGATGAVYPVTITNTADEAKTYTLGISGVESWGQARFDQGAVVVVPAGATKTVFAYVSANADATEGDRVFKLSIEGDAEAKEIPLTASVVGAQKENAGTGLNALEIGLIIVVIILILIVLIVGFNKLRGSDDDEDEDAKTYY